MLDRTGTGERGLPLRTRGAAGLLQVCARKKVNRVVLLGYVHTIDDGNSVKFVSKKRGYAR